jgi:hypothetical protein
MDTKRDHNGDEQFSLIRCRSSHDCGSLLERSRNLPQLSPPLIRQSCCAGGGNIQTGFQSAPTPPKLNSNKLHLKPLNKLTLQVPNKQLHSLNCA